MSIDNTLISICEPFGELVCTSAACRFVIDSDRLVQHLKRKHHIPSKVATKIREDITGTLDSCLTHRVPYWRRYFDDPYPAEDGKLLTALPFLTITAIVKCSLCREYYRGVASLRNHLNDKHRKDEKLPWAKAQLASPVFLMGQSLYSGPSKCYFPVVSNSERAINSIQRRIRPTPPSNDPSRDAVSRSDRSMNAAAAILNLSTFMQKRGLGYEDAYRWTTFESQKQFAILSKLIQDYLKFFSDRSEEVPQFLIDMVRIRNMDADANFSLHIKDKSKERYSRSVARFVVCDTNADKAGIKVSNPSYGYKLVQAVNNVLSSLASSQPDSQKLVKLHGFLRLLLLEEAKGSEGERVVLEDLFKMILVGFSSSKDNRIRSGYAEDASHLCAALQFICQTTALGEFLLPPLGFGPKELDGASTEEDRRKCIQAKLSTESATPAAFIRTTLRKTKRLSHGSTPRIEFTGCFAHPYCGFVDNIEISMDSGQEGSLGFAIRSIQRDTWNLLEDKILCGFKIPEHTWPTALAFADCVSCKDPGYFFGSHKDSEATMDTWAQSFASHLTLGSTPVLEPAGKSDMNEWKHSVHSTEWLQSCDKFMRLLYVLIHLCGGGPPRVTEMVHAKLKNTSSGRRSVFLYKGHVAVLVSYTKTQSQYEKPKPIARFLDKVTTILLLSYIIFVKPVQVFLMTSRLGQVGGTEEFLFTRHGDVMDEDNIYGFFKRVLHEKGVPFTILRFRHYRTGIVKTYMSEFTEVTGENAALLQSGHSESTAMTCYARTHLDFDFSGFTTAKVEAFLAVSIKWHELLGLHKDRNPRSESLIPKLNSSGTNIRQEKAVHDQGVSVDPTPNYDNSVAFEEIDANEFKIRTKERQECFSSERSPVLSKVAAENENSIEDIDPRVIEGSRRKIMPPCEYYVLHPKRLLQRFIGEGSLTAQFRTKEQEAATIECQMHPFIRSFRSALFVVLPTGCGKTVCWAAPALAEQSWCLANGQDMRISILVVRLISLQQDQLLRLRERGLCAVLWAQRDEAGASVIVCSIDVIRSDAYQIFLAQKAKKQLLVRIVVDEVHLVPLWDHFRDFKKLQKGLRPEYVDVPLVLLTATLPSALVPNTMKLLGIENSSLKTTRADIGRRNIKYVVRTLEEHGADVIQESIKALLLEITGMRREDKIIAFCLSVSDGETIRNALAKNLGNNNVRFYHGSMTMHEREDNFNLWRRRDGAQIMVATSALSCGIDCSTVRTVLHVGRSRNLVQFAQETGRAGRDGLPSQSITIYSRSYFNGKTDFMARKEAIVENRHGRKRVNADCGQPDAESYSTLYGSFKEYVECEDLCRRMILESFLNGNSLERCTEPERLCNNCCMGMEKPTQSQVEKILITECERSGNALRVSHVDSYKTQTIPHAEQHGALLPLRSSLTALIVPNKIDDEYLASQMWKAKELSLLKCAVCLVRKGNSSQVFDHGKCMRARCFRCVEYPANHQSASCDIVPRTKKGELRCYFCGIPKIKRCHEEEEFSKRSCPWLIVKNLTMMLWQDGYSQSRLLEAIPMLLPCVSLADVCLTLCGGMDEAEMPAMFVVVDYLHQRFVTRSDE